MMKSLFSFLIAALAAIGAQSFTGHTPVFGVKVRKILKFIFPEGYSLLLMNSAFSPLLLFFIFSMLELCF